MLSGASALYYVLLPVTGFLVGVFGSFTGLGGAMIMTPALAVVFGLPYPTAIGCTLAQMVGMSAAGVWRHWRLGHINTKLALNFLVGSVPAEPSSAGAL